MAMSKTGKVLLLVGGIIFALVIVGFVGLIVAIGTMGKPDVSDNSVLVLSVSGSLPDYVPEEPLAKAIGIKQAQSFSSLLH